VTRGVIDRLVGVD